MISLQVGDCWVWILIIFLVFKGLVLAGFGPHTPTGGVNLDHSLYHRSDGRSYVTLRVFCPGRQPSIIYEGIVLRLCIILREETVRE